MIAGTVQWLDDLWRVTCWAFGLGGRGQGWQQIHSFNFQQHRHLNSWSLGTQINQILSFFPKRSELLCVWRFGFNVLYLKELSPGPVTWPNALRRLRIDRMGQSDKVQIWSCSSYFSCDCCNWIATNVVERESTVWLNKLFVSSQHTHWLTNSHRCIHWLLGHWVQIASHDCTCDVLPFCHSRVWATHGHMGHGI